MELDDAPLAPSPPNPIDEPENNEVNDSANAASSLAEPHSVEVEEVNAITEIRQTFVGPTDNVSGTIDNSPGLKVGFQLNESVVEVLDSCQETRPSTLSGLKRPRESNDEEETSVQVIYKSLTGDSRNKLEELLQQWSQWHSKHCSSENDSGEILESGEEIYFPALQVGIDKPSTVSFWLDTETRTKGKKGLLSFDGNSAPVYDRSFALTSMDDSKNLEGAMEIKEASRCFNCKSFNHSLKDCPQPRNNVAVNNARKQLKAKRNQTPGSRNSSRYYQESVGGKYDGLKPGSLDSETRRALGLGMFDPPPWLNRMREIGYPPGYMDEDEDLPSGIIIFDDEEKDKKEEEEEGEIAGPTIRPELPKKKSVEFPGVNAPIPGWADENQWGNTAGNADSNMVSSRDHRSYGSSSSSRYNRSSSDNRSRRRPRDGEDEPSGGGGGGGGRHHQEQRWSHNIGDDNDDDEPPPPGCVSHSSSRDSRRDGGPSTLWSTNYERSLSDRSRRNPLDYDGSSSSSPSYRSYGHLSSSSPR